MLSTLVNQTGQATANRVGAQFHEHFSVFSGRLEGT